MKITEPDWHRHLAGALELGASLGNNEQGVSHTYFSLYFTGCDRVSRLSPLPTSAQMVCLVRIYKHHPQIWLIDNDRTKRPSRLSACRSWWLGTLPAHFHLPKMNVEYLESLCHRVGLVWFVTSSMTFVGSCLSCDTSVFNFLSYVEEAIRHTSLVYTRAGMQLKWEKMHILYTQAMT